MSDHKGNWMQLYSGRKFYPLDPKVEDIYISDIAHALSNLCRYGGHCNKFYSVAEHSVHVATLCETFFNKSIAFQGLLHDACEAYINDIPRPLKRNLPDYLKVEEQIDKVILEAFGLTEFSKEVKIVDNSILDLERKALMSRPPEPWNTHWELPDNPPKGFRIWGWEPKEAEERFKQKFFELRFEEQL